MARRKAGTAVVRRAHDRRAVSVNRHLDDLIRSGSAGAPEGSEPSMRLGRVKTIGRRARRWTRDQGHLLRAPIQI